MIQFLFSLQMREKELWFNFLQEKNYCTFSILRFWKNKYIKNATHQSSCLNFLCGYHCINQHINAFWRINVHFGYVELRYFESISMKINHLIFIIILQLYLKLINMCNYNYLMIYRSNPNQIRYQKFGI